MKSQLQAFASRWLLIAPLIAALMLAAVPLLAPPQPITIAVGAEAGYVPQGQGRHFINEFGWGEATALNGRHVRRVGEVSSVLLPWAYHLGDDLRVETTLCCGGGSTLELAINGVPHTTLVPADDRWVTERFAAPRIPAIHDEGLYLEWRSDAPNRPLLHLITVRAERPAGMLWGPLWLALAVAAIVWIGRREGLDRQRWWLCLVVASAMAGRWAYQPQALPWSAIVALGGLAAVAITAITADLGHRLALWLLALWCLAAPQLFGSWILDDAYISFRYAQNLVAGHGLTFNPGDDVVEGYTNFLWTITIAGALALGLNPVVTAMVLCSGIALATLLLCYLGARRWLGNGPLALLPPFLLALSPAWLLYAARGSGMETAQVTLLTLAALLAIWRADSFRAGLLAGIICALTTLARPDGALAPIAGGIWLLLLALRPSERRLRLTTLGGLIVGTLALYGPYFAWRFLYYGWLLPNTFYAKTGASSAQVQRGWEYTTTFFASLGARALAALLALSLVGLLWRRLRVVSPPGPAALLWIFVLLTAAYVTAVGGDHFPMGRFFITTIPPLTLLMAHGVATAWSVERVIKQRLGNASGVFAVLALALVLYASSGIMRSPDYDSRDPSGRIWGETNVALKGRDMGLWLRLNTPPETVIATGIAGALPYYAERTVIDTLGLNDVHIAHLEVETIGQGIAGAEKTDIDYVLDNQPDFIPFSTSGPFQQVERFKQSYERMTARGPEGTEILMYRKTVPE